MGKNIIKLLIAAVVGLFVNVNAIRAGAPSGFVEKIVSALTAIQIEPAGGGKYIVINKNRVQVDFDRLEFDRSSLDMDRIVGAVKKHLENQCHLDENEAKNRAQKDSVIVSGYLCGFDELQKINIKKVQDCGLVKAKVQDGGTIEYTKLYIVEHDSVDCFIVVPNLENKEERPVVEENIPCTKTLVVVGTDDSGQKFMHIKSMYPYQGALTTAANIKEAVDKYNKAKQKEKE